MLGMAKLFGFVSARFLEVSVPSVPHGRAGRWTGRDCVNLQRVFACSNLMLVPVPVLWKRH